MHRRRALLLAVATLGAALLGSYQFGPLAVGGEASEAGASAFGVSLTGPVPLDAVPEVSAKVPPGSSDSAEDSLLEVPADPLATSFTARVIAEAATQSDLNASLQSVAEAEGGNLPGRWNSRGYAIVEDLEAVSDTITADVIESESTVNCTGTRATFATATRIANLSVGGTDVPVVDASPNEVVFDQLGIRIVFWETNWNPGTGATTDGSDTVFANALHVTAPGDIDLVVSHSEASAGSCIPARGRGPREAPPAQPLPGSPSFTG